MRDLFLFAVLGLGAGAVYAILGLGLVLVHRGSGVVNFANGAIAMFATYQYVDFIERGVDKWVAFALTLVLAGIGGVVLYVVVIRALRSAPALARLVATLGMLLAIQAGAVLVYGSDTKSVDSLLPTESVEVFSVNFGRDRLWLLAVTIVLTVMLWLLYRFTRFGLATEAAAESEKGAVLLGYSPDAIGAVNWSIACVLAAVAGILIAPITSLNSTTFTLLIIPALAAALIGRFSSFGITATAGVLIGVSQSEITRYQSDLPGWFPQQGLKESLPFLVIILAMVVTGKLIPPRGSLSTGRPPLATQARLRVLPSILLIALVVAAYEVLDGSFQSALTTSLIAAVIALSLVVVTGYVGQISLAQMTFAGIGGFAVSKLASENGVSFIPSIVLAALIAVPVGLVIGLPALRVRGVNLAIVTLGAAVAVDSFVFQNSDWSGGLDGLRVPEPELFGWSIDSVTHPQRFGIFALVVLLACVVLVSNLRHSRTGGRMLAVRDNERAAAAAGINVAATKLQAFALSAFVAGLGGAVLGYQTSKIAFERFAPIQSIFVVAIAYIGGIASIGGAVVAGLLVSGGIAFALLGELGSVDEWEVFLSGVLLVVIVITQPDGIAVGVSRAVDSLRRRLGIGGVGGDDEPGDGGEDTTQPAFAEQS